MIQHGIIWAIDGVMSDGVIGDGVMNAGRSPL